MFPQPDRNAPASPGGLNLHLIVLTTRSSVALRKSLRFGALTGEAAMWAFVRRDARRTVISAFALFTGVETGLPRSRLLSVIPVATVLAGMVVLTDSQVARAVDDSPFAAPTELEAISATSPTDIWSVGYRDFGAENVILHWNGLSWSPVASPTRGKLFGVSAVSSTDAWAVGGYSPPQAHMVQTLVLHWDGLKWTQVPSPNPSTFLNQLYGVSARAPNDVWAVGYTLTFSRQFQSLLLHWNGTSWSTVRLRGRELFAVSAASPRSVWAGGFQSLLHWNGARWSRQSVQTRNFLQSVRVTTLNGVSAVSPSNVWAVGYRCAHYGACVKRTDIIHWNGRRWTPVPSPVPSRSTNFLNGVSALSATNVWAVGSYCVAFSCSTTRTLIVHWNGRHWSTVPSPSPGSSDNTLAAVDAISPSEAWAGGAFASGNSTSDTLLAGWDGVRWSAS
jgi:hypothetical protein